ncbi:MAG: glycosyl transferase [Frondihabitans sp.]|nr:glycosyl transferase [Frondihabitans sp.]
MSVSGRLPSVGVVSLTQGRRPEALARGLGSLLVQEGVILDIVCVGNGGDPGSLPVGVTKLLLEENVGIPAGRNRGADQVSGDYIFFLDDDAWLPSATFLRDAVRVIENAPDIGLLQPRVSDPDSSTDPGRWVPRIQKGDPRTSGDVFSVWEGATLLPRSVFDACGGWGEPYFYAHEGIELAWRVWGQGKRVWYAGDLVAHHPNADQTRHSQYYRLNARNRVWLAKRNLPWPLVPVYVASWTAIQIARWWSRPERLRPWFSGFREGWSTDPGGRRPLRWRSVWQMTRAGRPPLI